MRIDVTIKLNYTEYEWISWQNNGSPASITLTLDQAKALRDQITKHLRGPSRDKEDSK